MSHHDVTVKWMTSAQRLESNMSQIIRKYEKLHAEPSTLCDFHIELPTFDDDEFDSADFIATSTRVSLPIDELNHQVESFVKSIGCNLRVFGANDQVCSLVAPVTEENANDEDDSPDENFESDCDDSTSEIEPDLNDLASELTYLTSFRTVLASQQCPAGSHASSTSFLTSFQDLDIGRENPDSNSSTTQSSNYQSSCSQNTITNSSTTSTESCDTQDDCILSQETRDNREVVQTFTIHGLGVIHVPFINNKPNLTLTLQVPVGYSTLADENVPSEDLILRNFIALEEEIDPDLRDAVRKYVYGLKFDFLVQYLGSSLLLYQKIEDDDSIKLSVDIDSKRLQTLLLL